MTRDEAIEICAMLESNYQPYKDINTAVDLWASAFMDVPVEIVRSAILSYMKSDTSDFRPNVGKITKEIDEILNGRPMTEMEAWTLVRNAVSESKSLDSSPYREWKKLPEHIQQIVTVEQIIRWQMMDVAEMDTVIQSNFIKSYQKIAQHEYKQRVLPQDMKDAFALLQSKNQEKKPLLDSGKKESVSEMLDRLDVDAKEYREKHGMMTNPDYEDRVSAFRKSLTKEELKQYENKEKQKIERMWNKG